MQKLESCWRNPRGRLGWVLSGTKKYQSNEIYWLKLQAESKKSTSGGKKKKQKNGKCSCTGQEGNPETWARNLFLKGFCAEFLEFLLNKMSWFLAKVRGWKWWTQNSKFLLQELFLSFKFIILLLDDFFFCCFLPLSGKWSVDITQNFLGILCDSEPSKTLNPSSLDISWNCSWSSVGLGWNLWWKNGNNDQKKWEKPTLGRIKQSGDQNPRWKTEEGGIIQLFL